MRALPLLALALLAACAGPKYEVAAEPEVMVEEEIDPVASSPLYAPECTPGGDDGIGGTGCKID